MPRTERIHVNWYKYIDDADRVWAVKSSDFLAEVAGLEQIQLGESGIMGSGGQHECRMMKLVEIDQRPGRAKYRCDVITNERNPLNVLNKTFEVHGIKMRCIKFAGEEWHGY